MTVRRVVIESPFAGTPEEVEVNTRFVRAAMRDCLLRGEAPLASHALYTLPGVLDDNVPAERALGIEVGLVWGAVAELTVAYINLGVTPGMIVGIERAHREGRPVEYRFLPGWSA